MEHFKLQSDNVVFKASVPQILFEKHSFLQPQANQHLFHMLKLGQSGVWQNVLPTFCPFFLSRLQSQLSVAFFPAILVESICTYFCGEPPQFLSKEVFTQMNV